MPNDRIALLDARVIVLSAQILVPRAQIAVLCNQIGALGVPMVVRRACALVGNGPVLWRPTL